MRLETNVFQRKETLRHKRFNNMVASNVGNRNLQPCKSRDWILNNHMYSCSTLCSTVIMLSMHTFLLFVHVKCVNMPPLCLKIDICMFKPIKTLTWLFSYYKRCLLQIKFVTFCQIIHAWIVIPSVTEATD